MKTILIAGDMATTAAICTLLALEGKSSRDVVVIDDVKDIAPKIKEPNPLYLAIAQPYQGSKYIEPREVIPSKYQPRWRR